jgi:hypothetical protein
LILTLREGASNINDTVMKPLHRLFFFALPLLLLLGQQVALAHGLSHLNPDQPPPDESALVHAKLCGKCLSADKLAHAAIGTPGIALFASAQYCLRAIAQPACVSQALFSYFSRGPPVLL